MERARSPGTFLDVVADQARCLLPSERLAHPSRPRQLSSNGQEFPLVRADLDLGAQEGITFSFFFETGRGRRWSATACARLGGYDPERNGQVITRLQGRA